MIGGAVILFPYIPMEQTKKGITAELLFLIVLISFVPFMYSLSCSKYTYVFIWLIHTYYPHT